MALSRASKSLLRKSVNRKLPVTGEIKDHEFTCIERDEVQYMALSAWRNIMEARDANVIDKEQAERVSYCRAHGKTRTIRVLVTVI